MTEALMADGRRSWQSRHQETGCLGMKQDGSSAGHSTSQQTKPTVPSSALLDPQSQEVETCQPAAASSDASRGTLSPRTHSSAPEPAGPAGMHSELSQMTQSPTLELDDATGLVDPSRMTQSSRAELSHFPAASSGQPISQMQIRLGRLSEDGRQNVQMAPESSQLSQQPDGHDDVQPVSRTPEPASLSHHSISMPQLRSGRLRMASDPDDNDSTQRQPVQQSGLQVSQLQHQGNALGTSPTSQEESAQVPTAAGAAQAGRVPAQQLQLTASTSGQKLTE